jgi:predicted amidophosphoribosyltransferase
LLRWWQDSVADPLLSVLFPPRCVGCGDFETDLCDTCRDGLASIGRDHCPRCGEPGVRALIGECCAYCVGKDLSYAAARGAFRHDGVAKKLVAEFKYGGRSSLGRLMAELARPAFSEFVRSIAPEEGLLVTWVPCHRANKRQRGYNQAEVLARWLGSDSPAMTKLGLARKVKRTRHQKGLGRLGRQENLRGVFVLDSPACLRIPPRTRAILLVDDVLTTGATAKEVASALNSGTGLPVYVFTFSRAVATTPERHD